MTRRTVLAGVTAVVLVGGLILGGPAIVHAAAHLKHVSVGWTLAAVALELRAMGAYARLQRRLIKASGTILTLRAALVLTYAGNALNVTLPGGTVVADTFTIRRLRFHGASLAGAAHTAAVSSALSLGAFIALSAATGISQVDPVTVICVVVVSATAALLVRHYRRHPDRARRHARQVVHLVARVFRREPESLRERLTEFRRDIGSIAMGRRDWILTAALAAANWLSDCAALYCCCRAAGAHVSVAEVLTAFVLGVGASSVSFLPGGLGTTDAAMIVALRHGAGLSHATAAVLLYRFLTLGLLVGIGWITWLVLTVHARRTSVASEPVARPEPSSEPTKAPGDRGAERAAARRHETHPIIG